MKLNPLILIQVELLFHVWWIYVYFRSESFLFHKYIIYWLRNLMVCLISKSIEIACIKLCGGVHAAQRQTLIQVPIGFGTQFIGISSSLGVWQCEYTITTARLVNASTFCKIPLKYFSVHFRRSDAGRRCYRFSRGTVVISQYSAHWRL